MPIYTIVSWEYDEYDDSTEGFDIGGSDDSLEATFLARNEEDDNPAAICVTVNKGEEIIYIIDGITGNSDYIARRDGKPVTSMREARDILASKTVANYSPYGPVS